MCYESKNILVPPDSYLAVLLLGELLTMIIEHNEIINEIAMNVSQFNLTCSVDAQVG